MIETAIFDDFVTENELMTKFGLKTSIINRARKNNALPCYQISQQGPRLYLKSEVTEFFLSCRTVSEPKRSTKKRSTRKSPKE
jgi:hypothetical protein